jgi:amino acid transporter/nucleotide-binding universal stress UspA family protein
MLVQGNRPRVLHWYHAGPMLFGDWGPSRLYVLGLAFFFTGRSSVWFMGAMSVLLVAVGWAYDVICRHFPDGGGVYSAARQRSENLSVVGGLLLAADYVVTAALSALDAFHYLHLPHPELWAAAGIALVGVINFFGPTKAGTVALFVALTTIVFTLIIGVASVPHLGNAVITPPTGSPWVWWTQFTSIILAISGVEAVANMTGIMVPPVEKTARKSIWPVLIEIVILNMVLTMAMQALPDSVLGVGNPEQTAVARDTMLKILATHYVGPTFAAVAAFAFAALLLSAVNTAVTDLVSIQYMMARDRELPGAFAGLNRFGMPVTALVISTLIPLVTVLLAPDVQILAELYAIGVVGAVAINVTSCATNSKLGLHRYEQFGMVVLSVVMVAIWLTIAWEKPRALIFAGTIVGLGLGGRWLTHNYARLRAFKISTAQKPLPALAPQPARTAAAAPPLSRGNDILPVRRIMVATRGNPKLLQFAFDYAHSQHAELWLVFVRHIAVVAGPTRDSDVVADEEAVLLEQSARAYAAEFNVPMRFVYATATDIAETVLDVAATHAVDVLILGSTRRGKLWRAMKGDVIQQVAEHLPENISLLLHA